MYILSKLSKQLIHRWPLLLVDSKWYFISMWMYGRHKKTDLKTRYTCTGLNKSTKENLDKSIPYYMCYEWIQYYNWKILGSKIVLFDFDALTIFWQLSWIIMVCILSQLKTICIIYYNSCFIESLAMFSYYMYMVYLNYFK